MLSDKETLSVPTEAIVTNQSCKNLFARKSDYNNCLKTNFLITFIKIIHIFSKFFRISTIF